MKHSLFKNTLQCTHPVIFNLSYILWSLFIFYHNVLLWHHKYFKQAESRFAAVISGFAALPPLSVVLLHPRHNLPLPAGNDCTVMEHLHSQQVLT